MKNIQLLLLSICTLTLFASAQPHLVDQFGPEVRNLVLLPDTLPQYEAQESNITFSERNYMISKTKPAQYYKTIDELNMGLTSTGDLVWKSGKDYYIWSLGHEYAFDLQEFRLVSKEDSLFVVRYKDEITGSGIGKSKEYFEVWRLAGKPVRVAKLLTSFSYAGRASLDSPNQRTENNSFTRKVEINEDELLIGEGTLTSEVQQKKEGSDKMERSNSKDKVSPAYGYVFKNGKFVHKIRPRE